jgi:hypothetical protein
MGNGGFFPEGTGQRTKLTTHFQVRNLWSFTSTPPPTPFIMDLLRHKHKLHFYLSKYSGAVPFTTIIARALPSRIIMLE